MVRTAVVDLEAEVLERLEDYVAEFAAGFGYITRTRWAGFSSGQPRSESVPIVNSPPGIQTMPAGAGPVLRVVFSTVGSDVEGLAGRAVPGGAIPTDVAAGCERVVQMPKAIAAHTTSKITAPTGNLFVAGAMC